MTESDLKRLPLQLFGENEGMITSLETISRRISALYQNHPQRVDLEKEKEKITEEEREEVKRTFNLPQFPKSNPVKTEKEPLVFPPQGKKIIDLTEIDNLEKMVEQGKTQLVQARHWRKILESAINYQLLDQEGILDPTVVVPFIFEMKEQLNREKQQKLEALPQPN